MQKAFGPGQRKAFRDNYLAAFTVTALLLCSLFGQAQIFPSKNPGLYGLWINRVSPDSTLYFPTGCGVPTDSTFLFSQGFGQGEKKKKFAIYGDSCGHLVYYWDPSAQTWSVFGAGGGGGMDSTTSHAFYTKYRSDTSRANIYAAISALIAGKLNKTDSSGASGYVTHSQDDTAKTNLRNSIAGKKDKSDSTASTGYRSNGTADKVRDSTFAAIAGKQPTGPYITSLTGPITATGPGAAATTVTSHSITNANIVQMPARTVKSNITGSTGDQVDNPLDSLASHITPDSFRIYRKPGSDSVFACVTPVATGIEKCVFQYRDTIGTGSSDSGIAVRNGVLKTIAAGTIYLESDTIINQTRLRGLKLVDSMKAANDLRYKLQSDSTAATGYRTGVALDDTIYQKDPFTWQMSVVSPLSDSVTVGYRQDAPSLVRMANGGILCLWAVFPTTDVSDNGPCRIYGAISSDNGKTWGAKGIRINNTLSTHISTPSLFVQPNGNIICIANFKAFYAAVPTVGHTGANFYRYKSTDNGVTFTLMDSLFTSVTTYNYTSAGRLAQSMRTKRLFLPFGKQTTVIGHYLGGYFYSDDSGETWTQSGNTITPTDSSVNEPGIFIAQNNAPNDTSGGVERVYYFWTNTISPFPIKSVSSTDNGATMGAIGNIGFPTFASVSAFTGINSETEVVGLVNRFFVSNTTGQGITRKYMDIVSSIDGGRSFRRLTNLVGWDSGYHYFEPAQVYDSINGNMLAAISRMNDPQSRSDIRFYRIPVRTIVNPYNYDPPQFTVGADLRQMGSAPGSIVQIYSRDRDNKYSVPPTAYLNLGSASGTAGTFWPLINSAASTDFNGGLLVTQKIGNDGNVAYYSGAFAINATTSAAGTIATQPLFRVSNNTSTKFSVGPDGKTAIGSDSRVAWFSLPAGVATAGGAPIQFTAGPPTTVLVAGQLQYNTGIWIADSSASVRDSFATRSWVRNNITGGGGAVASVSNSDGTLTISPTTGAVVASLALSHANTWTGIQTFSFSPIAPTPSANDNSTKVPTTAYVDAAVATAARGNVTTIADADYTVASNVENIIYWPAITANRTVTLPSAASFTNRHIRIWFQGGNGGGGFGLTFASSSNIILTGSSAATTQVTNITNALADFQSDGTTWICTGFTH